MLLLKVIDWSSKSSSYLVDALFWESVKFLDLLYKSEPLSEFLPQDSFIVDSFPNDSSGFSLIDSYGYLFISPFDCDPPISYRSLSDPFFCFGRCFPSLSFLKLTLVSFGFLWDFY